MDADKLRAWWWARQGLDGSLQGSTPATILERAGWMRSVGGAGPYVGMYVRAGLSRVDVEAALAAGEIQELPSARGCTYVLPASDYALGLQAGQGFDDESELQIAKKYLGVTDDELARLREDVQGALEAGPLDPRSIKDKLGPAVRSLGHEGKKRGLANTLPLALGWLQSRGLIRRIPLEGRLDRLRYAYALWRPCPIETQLSPSDLATALASRYLRWAGPARMTQFATWSGLGVKAAKQAFAAISAVPVDDERFILPEDAEALAAVRVPTEQQVHFIGNMDGLLLPRRELSMLLHSDDHKRSILSEKGLQAGGTLSDLSNQAIVDRGRIIGVWDYDAQREELAWRTFRPASAAVIAAAVRCEAFVRDQLGDMRSFSLDSPDTRGMRLAAIRSIE
jgi:hypothetical protein